MNRNYFPLIILLAVTLLFAVSCAGSGTPTAPAAPQEITAQSQPSAQRGLWGMWQVSIDKTTREVEIIPLRGTTFNVNVTQFLHPPFSPINMLVIDLLDSCDFPNGYVDVDVTLNHPFPGINEYSGFDVLGEFFGSGNKPTEQHFELLIAEFEKDPVLLNPDGHTRWWNWTEFTDPLPLFAYTPGKMGNDPAPSATLNGYKYFADDLEYDMDVADLDPASRGIFTPDGPTHKRLYQIQFPVIDDSPKIIFNYAVSAAWDEPDRDYAPDYPPEAFGPGAQMQEAYNIRIDTTDSSLWYETGDFGGDLHLEIEVFDWQGVVSGVPAEVSAIWVESPVMLAPVDILPFAETFPGSQITSSVFQADLTGLELDITAFGDFPILVGVHSANPDSYQPQLDGGELFIYPDGPLAAYRFGSVNVEDGQGYIPADDVTGDLKLAVVRNSSQTITGLELDWSENTNPSPFYAIYADVNPYDSFDVDTFVAEVTSDVVIVDQTLWPDLSTNGAYVFGVKGRSVSGLSASDSPNLSEVAFVEMEDWDGGENPGPWVMGYREVAYKWEEQSDGLIDGSTSIRHNVTCALSQWSAYASPVVPSVPDSAMSFLEFAHIGSTTWVESAYKAHMGGHTKNGNAPPTGASSYGDLDNHDDTSVMDDTWNYSNLGNSGWIALGFFRASGDPYERGWRFFDAPHDNAEITRISIPEFRTQADNTRGAVAWGRSQYWLQNIAWLEMDEIAIVVY